MQAQTQQLQHTLSMNLMKSTLSTQAAQSMKMLEELHTADAGNEAPKAPHPDAGSRVDVRL
ncbi:hypothetical protein C6I21_09465 [Alkalicoccus urumqiensis]|uniref:Motility protein n=2 Tax=Alkalicoccus urumqiensis TaxID=1548213 RepID=A0A2P6MGI4_ALKUR|nr:hypothetical protein C6I21_09465 [Alkalicoccus urumqiensis]